MNMIKIEIPEFKIINAEHLVLDFYGTLAIDGHFVHEQPVRDSASGRRWRVHILPQ